MADIRELVLTEHMGARLFRMPGWGQLASRVKLRIRRWVVASAALPGLPALYKSIYRIHVSHAVSVLRKLPGTRAIYLARGVASGEIVYGVSDVDLVVLGDWTDQQHTDAMNALRGLSGLSPLYDASLWQHAHSMPALRALYESDFYYQHRFAQGRIQWQLLWGDDLIATLPPPPAERVEGGYYMELKNWWLTFITSALGSGVTARDMIFRNSIAYKTVGEVLHKTTAILTGSVAGSRRTAMEQAAALAQGEDRVFLDRLTRSVRSRHLRYGGDIREDALPFLIRTIEKAHAHLGQISTFQPVPGKPMIVDAPVEEVLRTPQTEAHAAEIVAFVKREWPGYRGAYLVPSVSFFTLDDLMLLIEIDPQRLPTAQQLRDLCSFHTPRAAKLTQRVALLLLLPHGAYQIEFVSMMEMWHLLICPAGNPDVFTLLTRPEFVLDGKAREAAASLPWTLFAQALIEEEIDVRRTAMGKVNADATTTPGELIRHLWRQAQLEAIERSMKAGQPVIPLTPRAVQRTLEAVGLPKAPVLDRLREAYEEELRGNSIDVRELIPELMATFAPLPEPRP